MHLHKCSRGEEGVSLLQVQQLSLAYSGVQCRLRWLEAVRPCVTSSTWIRRWFQCNPASTGTRSDMATAHKPRSAAASV
ncbi:hypothetical protein AAFF_G00114760 [Aldrovandia affinis]|uniref:Uncharacterized protein n=1 Tax=Aldrovandia affinis TaxID=143900 RepID=A0AAD7RTA7_9TELE|nr:hypothetical protein AAFF_G00114760 [Aldrovandia affinis]